MRQSWGSICTFPVSQRMQTQVASEGMRHDCSGIMNEVARVEALPPGRKPCPGAMGPHWTAWHEGKCHMQDPSLDML